MAETISRYTIVKTLGRGAMGVVYLARDERLKRDVAIKVLAEQYSQDPAYRRRFLTEAQSASALNHPGIITIYEIGTHEDRDFIAMEYVQGRSLQETLAERGPLPAEEIASIGLQIADALAAAHRAGIVHRDLKPGNVILTPEGRVKILDFGLARKRDMAGQASTPDGSGEDAPTVAASFTQPGMILGTPGFMAPEQARGGQADHLSDQFSLGCILHAMATGKAPFAGESVVDVLHSVLHEDPPPLDSLRADVPPVLQDTIHRCIQKRPEDRFEDVGQVASALRGLRDSLTAPSQQVTLGGGRPPRPATRRRLAPVLGAAVVLAAAATIVLLTANPFSGATTMTVSAQDLEGRLIEREVPTAEYRQRVAVFPFETPGADSSSAWRAYMPSTLLSWDLLQDHRLLVDELRTLLGTSRYAEEAKKAGYDRVIGTPLHLKRDVARASSCTHLVAGAIRAQADTFHLRVELHTAETSRQISGFDLSGADIFALIDAASLRLRRELGEPESYLREWPDLPVSDIATGSLEALELACRAAMAQDIDRDVPAAIAYLEQAVQEDPGFAMGYWNLYGLLQQTDRSSPARQGQVLDALMTHISRLPERFQFAVRASYFQNQGDQEKTLAVLKMWRDLYPHDIMPHGALLMVHRARGQTEQVIATLRTLIELDPGNPLYLQAAAEELQRAGDFEAAREYLDAYVRRDPDDPKARAALAELLQTIGEHEGAKRHLEHALLLSPRDPQIRMSLAQCEFNLGNLSAPAKVLPVVLAESLSPDERLEYTTTLADHYERTGQLERAVQVLGDALREAEGEATPLWMMLTRVELASKLAQAQRRDEALAMVAEVQSKTPLAFRPLAQLAPLEVHLRLGEPEAAEEAARALESTIDVMGLEILRFKWFEAMGRIRELQSDYAAACDFLRRRIELAATGTRAHVDLGRCYRKMGSLEKARETLDLGLSRSPYDPRILFELAKTEHELGRGSRAREHLERALEVWSNADSAYAPAREARETLALWERAS